jgi:hypothetical protein
MRLERLYNTIKGFSEYIKHYFDYGVDIELNRNGNDNYPLVYLEEPILGTLDDRGLYNFTFAILFLDKEEHLHNRNNPNADYKINTKVMDRYVSMMPDLETYLLQNGYMSKFDSWVTVREVGSDLTVGIRVELTLIDSKVCPK